METHKKTRILSFSVKLLLFLAQQNFVRSVPVMGVDPVDSGASNMQGDFYKYHGLSEAEFYRVQEKQVYLENLIRKNDNLPPIGNTDPQSNRNDTVLGCYLFNEKQINELILEEEQRLSKKSSSSSRQKRGLISESLSGRWSNRQLPWRFDGTHTNSEMQMIRQAANAWQVHTCIRMTEVTSSFTQQHVLVTKESSGCFSYIGRTPGLHEQQLNLEANCLNSLGTPMHEFGHALGFWHTQQRSDRNTEIRVNLQNVRQGLESQFNIRNSVNQGTPYDVNSVMHYGPRVFARGQGRVLETVNPLYSHNIGQRSVLSFLDAKIINREYCQGVCPTGLPRACANRGYQDPNACNRCRCPTGFGGTYCENVQPSNAACGGRIDLRVNQNVDVKSPGYDSLGNYQDNQECNWHLVAPRGYRVVLRFNGPFGVLCDSQQSCYHWVEVKYKQDFGLAGARFCCRATPTEVLRSESELMALVFRSYFPSHFSRRRGFHAVVSIEPTTPQTVAPTTTTSTTTTTTTAPTTTTTSPTTTTTTTAPTTTTTTATTTTTTTAPTTTTTTPTTTTTTPTTTTTTSPTTTTTRPTTTTRAPSTNPTATPTINNGDCGLQDLVIAIDASRYVPLRDWNLMLQATIRLATEFDVRPDHTRVGFIVFADYPLIGVPLNHYSRPRDIRYGISRVPHFGGERDVAGALRYANNYLFSEDRGARAVSQTVKRRLVLLTTGAHTVQNGNSDAVTNANQLRQAGVDVRTLLIGSQTSASLQEINEISDNNVERINSVSESDVTAGISRLHDSICGNPIEPTVTTTQSPNFQWSCSFETTSGKPTLCGMQQSTEDDFDWTLNKGGTRSRYTGPYRANSGNYYIYTEASYPQRFGDRAIINLPAVTSSGTYCIDFRYHMRGSGVTYLLINTLPKDISNGNTRDLLWYQVGHQSNQWLPGSLRYTLDAGTVIQFQGFAGSNYAGDIGLDDISIKTC